MERVTGIGDVFFRAQDPERLATWYAKYLGVEPAPEAVRDVLLVAATRANSVRGDAERFRSFRQPRTVLVG